MKESLLSAAIAVMLFLICGIIVSALLDGFILWILGGIAMWLTFRLAYAIQDSMD